MTRDSQPQPPLVISCWWNRFFHSRTKVNCGTDVFTLCGRLRILYALLLLFDRFILSYDFEELYLTSMMPCMQYYTPKYELPISHYSVMCTIAAMVPSTLIPYVYYSFFYVGVVNAVLLLFGIAPKLQLVLLHVNMLSFHHHSYNILDGEDTMFLLWNFLFLFLPLHRVTIYDGFRHLIYQNHNDDTNVRSGNVHSESTTTCTSTTTKQNLPNDVETWPMWPFRLWQIEVCCIYVGAGYIKLTTDIWCSGNALYRVCGPW